MSQRILAARLATPALLALVGLLQACTSLIEAPPAPSATVEVPAAEPAPVAASEPPAVTEGIVAAAQPEPAAEPSGPGDLFEVIRAGFQFEDPEQSRIDVQLRWYANNPEYLERVFGRSELYFHHIVAEIARRGMPLEIALLPVIESAFEPYAYSRARAAGLWQFIPGTGTRFSLTQNWWYDGRRDVLESTRAALDYLQYLHAEFDGDWLLAIAGYNCGEGCVARAVRRNRSAGLPTDFWSLRLPSETRAYVPKLLAMKRLVANPEAYGIAFGPIPNEPYFVRVETGSQIDLKLAAELAGITHDQLFELNPAFHRWATPPQGPHHLLLPISAADLFRQNLERLTPDELLRVTHHIVQPGETLATLATRYQTTPQVIREINRLGDGPIAVGADLRVPSGSNVLPDKVLRAAARVDGGGAGGRRPVIHVVRRGDSLWKIARRHNMSVNQLMRLNGLKPGQTLQTGKRLRLASAAGSPSGGGSSLSTPTANVSAGGTITHVVRRGDSLYRIAKLHGVTVAQLLSWNGIGVNAPLRPGQKITVKVPRRR
ncbi:MAG: LysM peptidoglycan-binding domain-containing protein [Steroidobacteraceae bacterium]